MHFVIFNILFQFIIPSYAGNCPLGSLKECQKFLKIEHAKGDNVAFATAYNEICSENLKFSCVKVTVRGDVAEEKKEQAKKKGNKASLFEVTLDGETYIYILAEKTNAK